MSRRNLVNISIKMIVFLCLIVLHAALHAELKTTIDPAIYNEKTVVIKSERYIQLQDGSIWECDPQLIDAFEVGKKVRIIIDFLDLENTTKIQLIDADYTVTAKLIDVPSTEQNSIEKIEWYHWGGEIQPMVTLRDGSQWLLSEFAYLIGWRVGDKILITKTGNCFCMYNLNGSRPERIVMYVIKDNYLSAYALS